jgi:carboxymethylenebutenolidase
MDGDNISFDDNVSRRKALFGSTAALGTAFALSVQPVQAQTMIITPGDGIVTGEVSIPTKDGRQMRGYRAYPATGTHFPTILVTQEVFGVHVHIADMCRRFAKVGYYAIAPELYFRQGDPQNESTIDGLMKNIVSKVPDAQVMNDMDSTVAFAGKDGGKADLNRLGITGFCWGGRIVWMYDAHNPAIKAGVAWYGPLVKDPTPLSPTNPIDIVNNLHGPVQGLYGGADPSIPQASVDKMLAALKASGNPAAQKSTIKVYPDTPHAFNADYRPSYRKAAADDGWTLCLAWFKANGVV